MVQLGVRLGSQVGINPAVPGGDWLPLNRHPHTGQAQHRGLGRHQHGFRHTLALLPHRGPFTL